MFIRGGNAFGASLRLFNVSGALQKMEITCLCAPALQSREIARHFPCFPLSADTGTHHRRRRRPRPVRIIPFARAKLPPHLRHIE